MWVLMTFPELPEKYSRFFDQQATIARTELLLEPEFKKIVQDEKDLAEFIDYHKDFDETKRYALSNAAGDTHSFFALAMAINTLHVGIVPVEADQEILKAATSFVGYLQRITEVDRERAG